MNRTNYKLVLPALLLLLITVTTNAQQLKVTDSLENKINLYAIKNQSPTLFIHFDKTIYSNNENVWFTAYLFNADYKRYKTLSLALVKDDNRAVVMEDKFVISNGLSFGNTFVPDSVGPGNYSFIATTNLLVNGKPDVIFTQPVTIKTEDKQNYTASLNPLDTSVTAEKQKVILLVNFVNPNPKEIPASVPAWYYIGNPSHPVLKDSVKTANGQYVFNIPSKLLSQGNNRLHVQLKYKKEVKEISIALPVASRPAVVRFYPEGGYLVNNTQSTIGWEVKNAAGNPIGVSAILFQNEKVIDTITTTSYGLGKFTLTPQAGSSYYVKLYGVNKKDTLYQLSQALMQGPALSLPTALVNDTLVVNLRDEQHEKLYLIGHNYKQLFFTTPVNMTTTTKRIKFILKAVPRGLTQLTLTDSTGRPFAERVFFAHYDQRTTLAITTDMDEYATRKKVTVKVRLDDRADSGFVSVACVQENRVEFKKKNDIESYFYLKHDLEDMPVRESYLSNSEADKQFLENVLLIKGWRKYTWVDMLKSEPADTMRKFEELIFKGDVTQSPSGRIIPYGIIQYGPLKVPVSIVNLVRPLNPVITDNTGIFTLTDNDVRTESDKKVTLLIINTQANQYLIHVSDPYISLNKGLSNQLLAADYSTSGQESTRYMLIADNEHAIQLKEVKINDKSDDSFFGNSGVTANACGDYVCRYNILNCKNHRNEGDNHPPVVGAMYLINGKNDIYMGCTTLKSDNVLKFKGIYQAVEFYPADYSQVNPSQPDYVSTIFWKHQLKVSSTKDAEFSFYTSDITGRYKIVVQGVTGTDVTYGEKTFNVVKAK